MMLLAGLATAAAADVVGLQWPENRMQQLVLTYQAASLLPIKPAATRPTIEERMAAAPFVTGEGRVGLDLASFDAEAAKAIQTAAASAGAGALLTYPSWQAVAEKLYGSRRVPATLAEWKVKVGFQQGDVWASVDVMSLLTKNKRRIWYNAKAVLEATVTSMESGQPISFAPGTWFLTEQIHPDGTVVEFHLLGKRADQELDYILYDGQGNLGIQSAELNMKAPTTCLVCHRNARRLTPFAEFPNAPRTVRDFKPEVQVTLSAVEREIAQAFVLTGARPDDTHGTYGGLAAIALRKQMAAGAAPAWGKALWPRLVKLVPALAR